MRFIEIYEAVLPRTIGILPGRFQPGHVGHKKAWEWMNQKFGDAYMATSDKVDPPRSPFNFAQKHKMLTHAGIPSDKVVQVKSPYRAQEIVGKFGPETVVVFGVSEKDMNEDPRFQFRPKKDGSPGYLQPYEKHKGNLQGQAKHAYVTTIPTFEFKVMGKPMMGATQLRALFPTLSHSEQAELIKDLYGSYDSDIHEIMSNGITQ